VTSKTTGDVVLGLVQSPVLTRAYVEQRSADGESDSCSYDDTTLNFMLWPDANRSGLVINSEDFNHAMAVCGGPETLSLDKLKKLGVGQELIDAIASGKPAPATKK